MKVKARELAENTGVDPNNLESGLIFFKKNIHRPRVKYFPKKSFSVFRDNRGEGHHKYQVSSMMIHQGVGE